jgi:signal transduction histidine kinase/DNA-binding response OmpR family regulator/HPt (histidine-containing phosphotransfer) domain-containing protein
MLHLDWRFFPVFDTLNPESNYVGVYDPGLVATSVVIAILAAYVALSISGRIAAAQTGRSRRAWISAGAVVMGGGIWAMHFIGMLAFSLPCGTGYSLLGTLASVIPGVLASGVALSVIGRRREPSLPQLIIGAVLMGAGIGAMHYSGMAAMEPEALLRYNPIWAAVSVVVAVTLAFIALSIRFRFARGASNIPATLAAAVMGSGVACMHYTAMRAALFFPIADGPIAHMALSPTILAVVITIFTVLIASITLVASFAGRQAELALSLRAEIAERERGELELIQARQQAEAANLAKSQFLATMSHEIRTPLNGVIGMANLLASTPLNSRQAQLVDNLARSGRSLLALINDILDFSRIEAQELALFEAPFEIREVIAEIADLFGEQCGSKGLDLIYSIAEDVPEQLLGDSVRLRQILINLVGNAVKFTEEGEILIEVAIAGNERNETTLNFSVRDSGIGIAADQLKEVFEPFRQADASMTRSRGGSGLGLAITKRLVELQGGKIDVESEPGVGSSFQFSVRFRRVSGAPDTPQESRQVSRPLRALLVDSNAVSARVTCRYLVSWRIDPTVVNSVRKARAAWQKALAAGTAFDVAVIDIKGLGAEGIELARELRCKGEGVRTEIILLVGMNNLAADPEIETLGACATLTKPARPSALFDCFVSISASVDGKGIAPLVLRRGSRAPVPSFDARVLVVEDNPINQQVAAGILENMNCRVVTAVNGSCAVKLLANEAFDLILMDCEMPVMDGFDAAKAVRELEAGWRGGGGNAPRVPIVALTAHALAEIREKCLGSGMDDFLVKPFDELQIGDTLRRWIPSLERASREKPAPASGVANISSNTAPAVIDLAAVGRIRAIQGKDDNTLFGRVVAQFAETAPSLAATLRAQYISGDSEAIWRTAHSLKSSAAALGAGRLSRRCAEIEALAREAGVSSVSGLLDGLDEDVTAAQTGLRELIGVEHV